MIQSVDKNLLLRYDVSSDIVAFSTRRGCLTDADSPYSSFNANPYCGDDLNRVVASQKSLASMIGVGQDKLIIPHQVHGKRVLKVDELFMSQEQAEREKALDGTDALVSNLKGVCLCISTADCVPVLVYDKQSGAMAAVHAGWRGTVQNIVGATLALMADAYGTNPKDCHAVIGPSISLDSFEVGEEVYEEFAKAGFDMSAIARRYPCTGGPLTEKWHIDLWEANRIQLLDAGLLPQSVKVAGICTYKNYEEYFSARRLTIKSGRIITGIVRLQ